MATGFTFAGTGVLKKVSQFSLVAALTLYCLILYTENISPEFRKVQDASDGMAVLFPRHDFSLQEVLMEASMPDKTVILTTVNEAWATPNSILDLFLESFRIGEHTRHLLNHLVIISLDDKAFTRCSTVHHYCFALMTEGVNFSREAYFMTPDYLKMMWRRIDFLRTILEMGYNFIFTDADVMWFRDPLPHFHPHADFQIACDHFSGKPEDTRNIPNGGFSFVRSNNLSIAFYKFWYSSRKTYPGLHDQDVLNRIKNTSFIRESGIKMRFLDTALFGGFCESSKDFTQICTMHANCCLGLSTKLHDLRILLEDWKEFMSQTPRRKQSKPYWRVPQNCSIKSLLRGVQIPQYDAHVPTGDHLENHPV